MSIVRKELINIIDHCLLAFCFIEPNSTSLFHFFIACLTFDTETVSLHISHITRENHNYHFEQLHTFTIRQDKTRQDKTRQDKTRQDKTRQDSLQLPE